MYEITYKPSGCKIGLGFVVVCCYIAAINFILSYYITYSKLATATIAVVSLLAVIRAVGIFSMYPGSFRYIAAQIEKRQNDHLLACIHKHLTTIIKISSEVSSNLLADLKSNHTDLSAQQTIQSIPVQLNILTKSENPSAKKIALINAYKNLISQLNLTIKIQRKHLIIEEEKQKDASNSISMAKIMENSSIVNAISTEEQIMELKRVALNCMQICKQIWSIVESLTYIVGPIKESAGEEQSSILQLSGRNLQEEQLIQVHKFEIAKWHMFQQKLFTMNSYFALWDKYFIYETFMIPIASHNQIQCAIIYSQKLSASNEEQDVQGLRPGKQAVLFSNPNGMFVQTMGLASSYIKFYLKWGFAIVLWNYRGYGKSTGIASVCKSMSDIRKVYEHVTKKLKMTVQVLHGYSIGGVCAINLAKELNQGTTKPIKLLIADRTFASIDRMAKGLIKEQNSVAKVIKRISKPVVRTLFKSDCIDNSVRFVECQCPKICIWDTIDTIVDKRASLRHMIISHAKNWQQTNNGKKTKKSKKQKQLSGQQMQIRQLANYAQQFATSSYILFETSPKYYEKVMKILCDTDGAGYSIFLPLKLNSQQNIISHSKKQIISSLQNYFVGLCIYGPKRDLPLIGLNEQMKYTEKRIQNRIQLIEQERKNILSYEEENQKCSVLIQSIISAMEYAKNQFVGFKYAKNREVYGNLIVSQVGHNCDLKKQYFYLEEAINTYVINQKAKEVIEQEKIAKVIETIQK